MRQCGNQLRDIGKAKVDALASQWMRHVRGIADQCQTRTHIPAMCYTCCVVDISSFVPQGLVEHQWEGCRLPTLPRQDLGRGLVAVLQLRQYT